MAINRSACRPLPAVCLLGICFVLVSSACNSAPGNPKVPAGARSSGGKHAVIETHKGWNTLEFFGTEQPKAVDNFRLLAEHG